MTTPVFVATFADGEVARMTTHCGGELDWRRGRNLARHAWRARDRRHRIEKYLADVGDRYEHRQQLEKFLAKLGDRDPPEIASYHFDVDGEVIREPTGNKSVQ